MTATSDDAIRSAILQGEFSPPDDPTARRALARVIAPPSGMGAPARDNWDTLGVMPATEEQAFAWTARANADIARARATLESAPRPRERAELRARLQQLEARRKEINVARDALRQARARADRAARLRLMSDDDDGTIAGALAAVKALCERVIDRAMARGIALDDLLAPEDARAMSEARALLRARGIGKKEEQCMASRCANISS